MVVGILQFELLVHGAESLKDKRRVIRSVRDRLHREHLVSVAEVASHDVLNLAVMGLAVVAADGRRAALVLDQVTAELRGWPGAELGLTSRAILNGHASELGGPSEDGGEEELAAEMLARGLAAGEDGR